MTGCATTPGADQGRQFRGTSGAIVWEVVDIGQVVSPDNRRMRWSYTVVLRETAGSPVQFENMERSSYSFGAEIVGGGVRTWPFRRRLEAKSEIRVPLTDSWGWTATSSGRIAFGGAATISPLIVEYRFRGTDGQARPTMVVVRVHLDRSVGKVVKPLETTGPLPPPRTLSDADLAILAGTWRGSYRVAEGNFDIPIEIAIRADGSFEASENEPVTNRYRGTLRIQDGKLTYSQRNDTGTLTLHEGSGQRFLAGHVTGQREGVAGAPPYTMNYAVRLESIVPSAATTRAPAPSSLPASAASLKGIYRGSLLIKRATGNEPTAFLLDVMLADPGTLSGTWKLGEGGGLATGYPLEKGKLRLRMLQSEPCEAEYTADVTITDDGAVLAGSLTGASTCGGPLTGPFSLFRQ